MNKIMRVFEILLSAPLLCPSRDLYIHGDISLACSSHLVVAFSFESSGLRLTQSIRSNSYAGTRIHVEFLTPDPVLSLLTEQSLAYFTVHEMSLSEKWSLWYNGLACFIKILSKSSNLPHFRWVFLHCSNHR